MKTSLTLDVPYFRDSGIFGRLLFELMRTATRSSGVVSMSDIEAIARQLGYLGSIDPLRRILLARGYLYEVVKNEQFGLQQANRDAIMQFIAEHQPVSTKAHLSGEEFAKLFTPVSDGSQAEMLLLKVMKKLTLAMAELHQVSTLEVEHAIGLGMAEVEYSFQIDRMSWYRQQMDAVDRGLDVLGEKRDLVARWRRYFLRERLVELRDEFLIATNKALEQKDLIHASHKEKEQLELLRSIQCSLILLGVTFTKKEGEMFK